MPDPLPLSPRQVWALLAAASRQLLGGLRAASLELELGAWRERALAIPDAPIREDALTSIDSKRGHADGAALFAILPRHRDLNLLRLLVRHQIIWDYLDCLNERAAANGTINGRQLHLALIEALDTPGRRCPITTATTRGATTAGTCACSSNPAAAAARRCPPMAARVRSCWLKRVARRCSR